MRRGSALAEFVLFLPFLFFILLMIFHFGVSSLRKQRTIVAARFATDADVRGIGDANANDYWVHPISGNRYDRGQAFPDRQDHFLGLYKTDQIQPRFLPRVPVAEVEVRASSPPDGVQDFKAEIERRDTGTPRITDVTRTFWEQPIATIHQSIGPDIDYRWHEYARGSRVQAPYSPAGRTFERLQGPIASHYFRESASWAFPHPDMWWELTRSSPGLAEAEKAIYELTQDPRMGRTADALFRWFQH